jgi:hypothetical protein
VPLRGLCLKAHEQQALRAHMRSDHAPCRFREQSGRESQLHPPPQYWSIAPVRARSCTGFRASPRHAAMASKPPPGYPVDYADQNGAPATPQFDQPMYANAPIGNAPTPNAPPPPPPPAPAHYHGTTQPPQPHNMHYAGSAPTARSQFFAGEDACMDVTCLVWTIVCFPWALCCSVPYFFVRADEVRTSERR